MLRKKKHIVKLIIPIFKFLLIIVSIYSVTTYHDTSIIKLVLLIYYKIREY